METLRYRNITVELLLPQEGEHDLCFGVIPDKPLNCPAAEAANRETSGDQHQFESAASSVHLGAYFPSETSSSAILRIRNSWSRLTPNCPQWATEAGREGLLIPAILFGLKAARLLNY
jgi:hypothetical protein